MFSFQNPALFSEIDGFVDRMALIEPDGRSHSFGSIAEKADAAAQVLKSEKPGLVFIEMENDLKSLVHLIGACRAGCPVLLAHPQSPDREWLFQTYRPSYCSRADGSTGIIRTHFALPKALHPDLALLLPTSGSAGAPKCVRLSRQNIRSNTESIQKYLKIGPDERAALTLPLSHAYGLSILASHWLSGAAIVLSAHAPTDPRFWHDFDRHRATSFSNVPLVYEQLAKTGFLEKRHPSLRTLTQAGGRLSPDLVTRFAEYGKSYKVDFVVMYGQTEASPRITYLPPELARDHPDSIGQAIPGGRIRLISTSGTIISAPGHTGELLYRGSNVMMGYAETYSDLTRGAETGELATGDLAEWLPSGLLRLVGRKDRIVKIAGQRICLDALEHKLKEAHDDCIVAGDADGIVVASSNASKDASLAKNLAAKLRIPKTAVRAVDNDGTFTLKNGKPDYVALLSRTKEDSKTPEPLERDLALLLGRKRLDPNDCFIYSGGDSLNLLEASILVERFHGQAIPGWEIMPFGQLCREQPLQGSQLGRRSIDPLVIGRSLAIFLALLSHAFVDFGIRAEVPDLLCAVTMMATPCFIIIFGIGLARNYHRPSRRFRLKELLRRMLPKAALIYAAIICTQLTASIADSWDITSSFAALTFTGHGRYIDLLTIYFFLYLAAPFFVISLERSKGFLLPLYIIIPWLLWPFLREIESSNLLLQILFGLGGNYGPSVLYASCLVLFGYSLGAFQSARIFRWTCLALGGICSVFLIDHILTFGWTQFILQLDSFMLRLSNHPTYYAFGVATTLAILALATFYSRGRQAKRIRFLFALGYHPIIAFTLGNMILTILPNLQMRLLPGLILSFLFVTTLAALCYEMTRGEPKLFGGLGRFLQAMILKIYQFTGNRTNDPKPSNPNSAKRT